MAACCSAEHSEPLLQVEVDAQGEDLVCSDDERGDGDVVQFATLVWVCTEKDRYVELDVIRIGKELDEVSVRFATESASALAGVHFKAAEDTLTFAVGERSKLIKVELIPSSLWNATLEFKVRLFAEEGCQLDIYSEVARVKLMDNNYFPSDKFESYIRRWDQKGAEEIPVWQLWQSWMAFVATRWDLKIRRRVCIHLALGVLMNANKFLFRVLQVILIDHVLTTKNDGSEIQFGPMQLDRRSAAMMVCFLYIVPILLLHGARLTVSYMDLEGSMLAFMRCSVFRKYLNVTPRAREVIPPSDILLKINDDCKDVCAGFMAGVHAINTMEGIALLVFFSIREDPASWYIYVTLVAVSLVLVVVRGKFQIALDDQVGEAQGRYVDFILQSMKNFVLITSAGQRPRVNDEFKKQCSTVERSMLGLKRFELNNKMLVQWVDKGFLTLYTILAIWPLLSGQGQDASRTFTDGLTIGKFVAVTSVMSEINGNCEVLFELMLQMTGSIPALRSITTCLGAEIEVTRLKDVIANRRQDTREAIETIMRNGGKRRDMPIYDSLHLRLEDVKFRYSDAEPFILQGGRVEVEQGSIVRIMGPHSSCRFTLLQLLAQLNIPVSGKVFVPMHLRTFFVPQEPMLVARTVWENLVYCCTHKPNPLRVVKIAKMMKMPRAVQFLARELLYQGTSEGKLNDIDISGEELQEELSEISGEKPYPSEAYGEYSAATKSADGDHHLAHDGTQTVAMAPARMAQTDADRLSHSEKAKVNLARALIMNPEVLVLQRPLANCDDKHTEQLVCNLIREHVDERGLVMQVASRNQRRPRTVFYSRVRHTKGAEYQLPDKTWKIESANDSGSGPPFEVVEYAPDQKLGAPASPQDRRSPSEASDA